MVQPPERSLPANDSQHNFVEAREPSELVMCLVLAAAYLGLAKYCWMPLMLTKNWRLLFNVEGFFLSVALLAILLGVRPYLNPSSLQISSKGLKYLGPYWPRRKTVNWDQVLRLYLSSEIIIVLYKPDPNRKRTWPLVIASIYLAEREKIAQSILEYCPIEPIIMTSPALISRIAFAVSFFLVVIWLLELVITSY
jgi:hypothetical protein